MDIEIDVYQSESGQRPFEEWFDELPAAYSAKVTRAVVRLGCGNRSGLKSVGEGVSEWRIDWGPGIRIYVAFDGTKLINSARRRHQEPAVGRYRRSSSALGRL